MPRMNEALDSHDDWRGLKDLKARRKVQNRLNQRAARRRKDPGKVTHLRMRIEDVKRGYQTGALMESTEFASALNTMAGSFLPNAMAPRDVPATSPAVNRLESSLSLVQQHVFTNSLHLDILPMDVARHRCQFSNPMSADHLITLVAHNIHRALLTNTFLLRIPNPFCCDVTVECLLSITALPLTCEVPPSLHPTALQASVQHPPWMDTFPVATVRNNLIQYMGFFDEDELCVDILGALMSTQQHEPEKYERGEGWELRGLIVWGDPWRLESWELTHGFLTKWGWIFRGCEEEILAATNFWRGIRAEEPLRWEGNFWEPPYGMMELTSSEVIY